MFTSQKGKHQSLSDDPLLSVSSRNELSDEHAADESENKCSPEVSDCALNKPCHRLIKIKSGLPFIDCVCVLASWSVHLPICISAYLPRETKRCFISLTIAWSLVCVACVMCVYLTSSVV